MTAAGLKKKASDSNKNDLRYSQKQITSRSMKANELITIISKIVTQSVTGYAPPSLRKKLTIC